MQRNFQALKSHVNQHLQRMIGRMDAHPALKAVLPMLVGLAVVFLCNCVAAGKIRAFQPAWFLPAPLFVYIFLRQMGASVSGLYIQGSLRAANIAASGFFLALFCKSFPQSICLITGLAGALFTFVDVMALRFIASRNVQATVMAGIGSFSGYAFFMSQKGLWKLLATLTAKLVYWVLHPFITLMAVFPKGGRPKFLTPGAHPGPAHQFHHQIPVRHNVRINAPRVAPPSKPPANPGQKAMDFMAVASDQFTLKIAIFQNITAGIFLFLFLLSLELTLSGKTLKPRRLAGVIAGGIAGVVIINALLLAGYFAVVHAAKNPEVNPLIEQTASALKVMFSSPLVSFVGYLVLCTLIIKLVFKSPTILNFRSLRAAV